MMTIDSAPQWGTIPKDPHPKTKNELRDHYRGTLNISTPVVEDEAVRKRWHGAPPTKLKEKPRQGGTITF